MALVNASLASKLWCCVAPSRMRRHCELGKPNFALHSSASGINISFTSFKNNAFIIYPFCDATRSILGPLGRPKGNKLYLIVFVFIIIIEHEKSPLAHETRMTVTWPSFKYL